MSMASKVLATSATFFAVAISGSYFSRDPKLTATFAGIIEHSDRQVMSNQKSTRHERTRRDHSMETAEDYVEAVAEIIEEVGACRVIDLARHFAVSHVTVSKTVTRLKTAGYLTSQPYGPIELTRNGKRLATESKKRHQTVLEFLLALGIRPAVAEVDAEGMEHHVSQETLKQFKKFTDSKRQK
jgi:DtxR family manganese transport transcriptional regulator